MHVFTCFMQQTSHSDSQVTTYLTLTVNTSCLTISLSSLWTKTKNATVQGLGNQSRNRSCDRGTSHVAEEKGHVTDKAKCVT